MSKGTDIDLSSIFDEQEITDPQDGSGDFDIFEVIENLLAVESPVPRDLNIPDGDIPLAKNYFDFVSNPRFLGLTMFARQIEVGIKLYAEWCPNPKCTDVTWWTDKHNGLQVDTTHEEILEKVTLLEHGKCPKCKTTKAEWFRKGKLQPYTEMAGLAGQRSGKSMYASTAFAYTLHQFMKLNKPAKTFGEMDTTPLTGTFTSLTFAQAKALLFDPLLNLVNEKPWFKEYHKMLKEVGDRRGEELYTVSEQLIRYKHRNVVVHPAAPDMRKLRGATRFMGGVDEIGLFISKQKDAIKINVDEVYKSLNNSFTSLRLAWDRLIDLGYSTIPSPMFINISSPSSAQDKICRLYRQSQRPGSRIFGFHYATWEFNPKVTKAKAMKLAEDEAQFWRDYGAVPPDTDSPFFDKIDGLKKTATKSFGNAVDVRSIPITTRTGKSMTGGACTILRHDKKTPRILTIDAGASDNSFAFSVMHNNFDGLPQIDALGEIMPLDERPINFTNVYKHVLSRIIPALNVKLVVADRWQSKKILDDIEDDFKIETLTYSVTRQDFVGFRNDIYENAVVFPYPEIKFKRIKLNIHKDYKKTYVGKPIAHLYHQMITVRDLVHSIEKGERNTDDILRAVVLAHSFLIDPEYAQIFYNAGHGGHDSPGIGTHVGLDQQHMNSVAQEASIPHLAARPASNLAFGQIGPPGEFNKLMGSRPNPNSRISDGYLPGLGGRTSGPFG